jgi:hypothetical protein
MTPKTPSGSQIPAIEPSNELIQNFFVPNFETVTSANLWRTLKRIPFMRKVLRMMILDKTRQNRPFFPRFSEGIEKTCCQTPHFSLFISANAPFWASGKPDLP